MASKSGIERFVGWTALLTIAGGSVVGLRVVPADAAMGDVGMMWGKPTWGVWWTWDPRLTTTAILLAIYVGYLAIRGFADDPEKRARWAAVVGIIGFANVPIVYLSVVWWRTLHQPPSSPRSVSPEILWTLMLNLAAFTLVYAYLMMRRTRLAALEGKLEQRVAYHG